MSKLDEYFKFQIGDFATMKFMADAPKYIELGRSKATSQGVRVQPLVIIERHLQECEGGMQAKYLCRVFDAGDLFDRKLSFVRDLFAVNEGEITPLKELPATESGDRPKPD